MASSLKHLMVAYTAVATVLWILSLFSLGIAVTGSRGAEHSLLTVIVLGILLFSAVSFRFFHDRQLLIRFALSFLGGLLVTAAWAGIALGVLLLVGKMATQ